MITESEIIEGLIAMGVLIFVLINYLRIKELPKSKILISSFFFLLLNNVFSILEDIIWADFLNVLQHSCLAICSILLVLWLGFIITEKRKKNGDSINL